jgi:serine phosphatase RsbU (regulator of sigma subunit)/ligand-binding sensor domain-containing protein
MKHLLIFISISVFFFSSIYSQEAQYPVINYTTKDYGRDFNPENWAITQDNRGLIYAANGFNLLEYDGSQWNSYLISKAAWILSLAVDSSGIIYCGSQNEFGLFAPDSRGELKYQSLSDSLEPADMDFSNIRKIHPSACGVVFQAEEKLFIYKNGKVRVVKPETSFHTSFVVNGRLFVRQRGTGLMEFRDDKLSRIKGGEIFDTTGVFFMVPFGRNGRKILIGTREKGFWTFEPDFDQNSFKRFVPRDNKLLGISSITGGVLTGDGSVAIGTMLNGIIVIDTAGKTKAIINKSKGLSDNDVKQLVSDQGGNLWAALNNGISMIGFSSPLSELNERSGINGSVNAILRFGNLLYVGTSTGLFVQSNGNDNTPPFKPAFGISVPVNSLISVGSSLLAGTDAGIFRISDNQITRVDDGESKILFYSHSLNLMLSGGPKGLSSFRFEGSTVKKDIIRIDREDIIGIDAENITSGNASVIWIGTRVNGVIRIKVNKDLSFTTDRYDNSDGLPESWVIPSSLSSNTLFGTMYGIYGFTNEDIVKESVPDSLKDNKKFTKGYFSEMKVGNNGIGKSVSFLLEKKSRVWICSDNEVGYLVKSDSLNYEDRPFRGIEAGRINTFFPEENGFCWIGTTDGLIRYDENLVKDYDQSFQAFIRRVTITDIDSAVFMGTAFSRESGLLKITTDQPAGQKISLSYSNNSLRIVFSASFYEYPSKILYSYKLEGGNPKWSQWTKENFQEFNNLREGTYTFIVKARNIYGKESSEARYSFSILPPWYRSAPAYIIYIVTAFLLFWLFARLYSYRLKRENIRLEGIVAERTAEVVRQKDLIVEKNIVLEHQKKEIEDSIRYAMRIQSAVLPSEKIIHDLLPDSFVFFRPLNIVSGDFYWISQAGSKIIYTAADCTGHGVPGAFMSMLGTAFLDEIVNKDNITSPDMILNLLREKVIDALQQRGLSGEARDGMDMALISIDVKEGKLEYAGAYNALIMIRNGEVTDMPGNKMPIAIYDNMHPFTKHEIKIEKGDVFYMFSDGYEDQFGGPDGKKFKSKRLKCLLLEIRNYPMEKQKEMLERNFDEWKGDLPQVDDVVVVGLAIK